jgi:hypothetical protein
LITTNLGTNLLKSPISKENTSTERSLISFTQHSSRPSIGKERKPKRKNNQILLPLMTKKKSKSAEIWKLGRKLWG